MSLLQNGASGLPTVISTAELARGDITVTGPDGYCIDQTTLRSSRSGGFAAMASCNIMSGGTEGAIVEPALVTVTVSAAPDTVPSPADLAAALQTDLLQSRELSALAVGQMATGGENAFAGSDAKHWRGAFVTGDYLVGVTLYAPQGSPLIGAQGAAFLNTVSSNIRAKSRSRSSSASAEQSQSQVDPLAARLGRLFARRDL
ncbi:dihydroxy-acid dehydratase [Marivita sp. XM-24bin2]|jgi:hypothetical protein|uniref:dihydroxy-acid dehydratase n=1 Tax=unclassified Marivita TaxID=2632480 RepID=UPI0025B7F020|nr:dihydroxy-acid dehydratase [Marivita sp. XM-24bin2]MCR9110622.1 dihydroxy-acid dehydratase [Paracoccaceae bacterium]